MAGLHNTWEQQDVKMKMPKVEEHGFLPQLGMNHPSHISSYGSHPISSGGHQGAPRYMTIKQPSGAMFPAPPDTPYHMPPRFLPIGNSPGIINDWPQVVPSTSNHGPPPQFNMNPPSHIFGQGLPAMFSTGFQQGASKYMKIEQPPENYDSNSHKTAPSYHHAVSGYMMTQQPGGSIEYDPSKY
eukprot:Platyproteum_vivax@DN7356_c0_g1_i3.p1